MTRLVAPKSAPRPIRLVCKHCKSKFIPKRADADFCRTMCKQAAYRMRKKVVDAKAEADALFRIAKNTQDDRWWLEWYRSLVVKIRAGGLARGVEFSASPKGILVAERVAGALQLLRLLELRRGYRETVYRSGDPEIPRLIGSEDGAPFLYREAAKGFAAAMRRPVHSIALFTWDWDLFVQQSRPIASLPNCDWEDRFDADPVEACGLQVDGFIEDEFDPREGDIQPAASDDPTISDWLDAEWNDRVTDISDN